MNRDDSWVDGLAEGVVLVEHGLVWRLNSAAARLLAVEPATAVGKRLITVVRDHRLERVWSHGEKAEVTLAGRTIRAVPLPGGIALRDISEARQANENAKSLLAVLSHELRTPMTTVRATLDALGFEDIPADERSRLLERALGEADRLVRLLDDLTADVTPPRERTVSLTSAVDRAELILAGTLSERAVELRHDLGRASVWADPDKLLQVLLNLVENAALHGPANSRVEVVAVPLEGWVALLVRDEGEPLATSPTALAERLVRPSFHGRSHGLGLFVVRSVAEAWGGSVWWQMWGNSDRGGNQFGVMVPGSREATRRAQPPLPALLPD